MTNRILQINLNKEIDINCPREQEEHGTYLQLQNIKQQRTKRPLS